MKPNQTGSAFPDLAGEWAAEHQAEGHSAYTANDNIVDTGDELSDPLLALAARADIDATRLW